MAVTPTPTPWTAVTGVTVLGPDLASEPWEGVQGSEASEASDVVPQSVK